MSFICRQMQWRRVQRQEPVVLRDEVVRPTHGHGGLLSLDGVRHRDPRVLLREESRVYEGGGASQMSEIPLSLASGYM